MATLAELLRLKEAQTPEQGAYIGYPQISNRPRQQGAVTGFLTGASGLPAQENLSVLNPQDVSYMQGQNYGELANAGLALTGVPALLRAMPKTVAKAAPIQLDAIGQALENRRLTEFSKLLDEYKTFGDAKAGKIINTDVARELSPEYRANRTLSANVHEPASQFTKQYYAEMLKQPPKENSFVLFTGGGTGAGKTSSLNAVPRIVDQAEMVYDTNMNKLPSAVKKIDQALDSGRKVSIAYTFRDPVEALTEGALTRAMRMKKELGSGRTVPIEEHLKTHIGARNTIDELMKKYKDNKNVDFTVIDNSLGKDMARATDISTIPQLDEKVIKQRLRDALEEQFKAGKIDEDVYKGTLNGNK
jgi:ribosomal protein S8E